MTSKIAYLCGTCSWGGLEMNQLKSAKRMQEKGISVAILAQKKAPISKFAIEQQIQVIEIQKHKNHFDLYRAFQLYRILRKNKFTHLIVRSVFDLSIGSTCKAWLGKNLNYCYFQEMQISKSKKQWYRTLRYRFLDFWVSPSTHLLHQAKENIQLDLSKLKLIPSAIEEPIFLEKEKCRSTLDIPHNHFIFGILGRIDPQKGQLLALKAWKSLNLGKSSFLIVGDPTKNEETGYFTEIQNFIIQHNLQNQVFIRNYNSDVSLFYNAIDCFILPSKSESFGMVTIEALSYGLPIIGSNRGSTPEILQNGKLGLLFESENQLDLAKKMNDISKSPTQFNADQLKKESEKYFSKKIIPQVIELLKIT